MIPVRVDPAISPYVVSTRSLDSSHPLYGTECPACGEFLWSEDSEVGVALVLVGRAPDERWTAGSVAIHVECAR